MSAVDYASNPQALNDKLAQHNDKWVQQEERNKKQEIQIAELLGKTLYLARDKGFILSKALLDHIEAAATGHPIQGESKNLALADTFSRNDGNIREVIMDAVHDCPGLENLSAEEFLQHALQTTRLRNGVAHERAAETLVKACYAYLEQGLLDSLKEHPIDRHLLANVDVFKLQVLARPCCKRLAARLLSLAKDKVAAGSRQWKTALDLRKGNVRAQRYVQLLLKAVPALGTDVADFGLKASEAMGHLKGDLGLGDWGDIHLAIEACQEVGMFAKPRGMEFEVQTLTSSRHFEHACLLLDVPPT